MTAHSCPEGRLVEAEAFRIAMGAGAHGYSLFVDADELIAAYDATVADISQSAAAR